MNALFHRGHALLIGVGGDLPCTTRDVEGLHDILIDPDRCAYSPDHVRLLTEEKASVKNIRAELRRLAGAIEKDKQGSTVIVYFSGHGGYVRSQEGDAYYLVASQSRLNKFQEITIQGKEFTTILEAIPAERLLLVLDCCHAGGIELPRTKGATFKELPPQVDTVLASKQGRVVLASSKGAELSLTGTPYSAFTHSFLEALCGKGNPRRDGFVRVGDMVTYTSEQVPLKTRKEQHPTFDFNSENFEIAYYGGGNTRVKSLPFESWKPETTVEPETTSERRATRNEIVTRDTLEGNKGPITRTGVRLAGLPDSDMNIRTEDILKNNKNKIDSTGVEINLGRSPASRKRNNHGE
jgi:hypothetical protein